MSYFLSYFPSYIPSYIPKVTTHIEESDRRGGRSHTCLHRSELGTWHVSAYVMTGWHSHRCHRHIHGCLRYWLSSHP